MNNKLLTFGKDCLIFVGFFFFYAAIYSFISPFISNFNETGKQIVDLVILTAISFLLFIYYKKELSSQFKDLKNTKIKTLGKYLAIYIVAYFSVIIINSLLYSYIGNLATGESANRAQVIKFPFISFISMTLLAPFYEEIIVKLNFRNLFKTKWTYIIITGIFFGFLHLLSVNSSIEYLYIIPYSILGITLSYIYRDSENIFYSIIFHSLNNIIQLIIIIFGGIL